MLPLTMASQGEPMTIKKIGGKQETKKFLETLGFVVGGTRFQSAPSWHISRRNLEMVVLTDEIDVMGNITIWPTFIPRKVDAQFSVTFTISLCYFDCLLTERDLNP